MTCIVALKTSTGIIVAGDSAASNEYHSYPTGLSKVFRNDSMIIGYTSSFRMGQILEYKLNIPNHPANMSDLGYLVTHFIDALRECLSDSGFASRVEETERGGSFIMTYRNEIYYIGADYQVNTPKNGIASVGAGYEYALGSLHSTEGLKPIERVTKALNAASYYSPFVRLPFVAFEAPIK
jgi:ATP-dependent protease HslVU (ClpYQ) peptidase subunit